MSRSPTSTLAEPLATINYLFDIMPPTALPFHRMSLWSLVCPRHRSRICLMLQLCIVVHAKILLQPNHFTD